MRHIVRPFMKEYKNRSSRSSALQHKKSFISEQYGHIAAGLAYLETESSADGQRAALKAANLLFDAVSTATEDQSKAPASAPLSGRILASLIEQKDSPIAPAARAKAAGGRQASPPRPRQSAIPLSDMTDELNETEVLSEPLLSSHAHRSIQGRWVLKTELKPGEKWKRRLPKAAR